MATDTIEQWSTTAASNNNASPNGWPENMSSAGLNDTGRMMMAAVAKAYQSLATYASTNPNFEWLDLSYGKTITRVSDTQITVGSYDCTSWATANRRIRIINASTTADGFIVSSSFSTNTTINVLMDGGTVPTTPTKVFLHVGASLARGAFSGDAATLALQSRKVWLLWWRQGCLGGMPKLAAYPSIRAKYRLGERLRPCPGCAECFVCLACENGTCKREHHCMHICDGSGVLPAKRHRRCGWWLQTRTAKNATQRCGMPLTFGGWLDCQNCGGSGWLMGRERP